MRASIGVLIAAVLAAALLGSAAADAGSRFCQTRDLAGEWRHHQLMAWGPEGEAREFHITVDRQGVITRVRQWSPWAGGWRDRDTSDWEISINRFCTVEYYAEFEGGLCALRGYMNQDRDEVSGTGRCNHEPDDPFAAFWTLTKR